jgi:gluconate kinase
VEENLLYVDADQVHEEQNVDEGDGANFHHEEEHHDREAGELNNNERWAWMQTEVERISIEQQRQGVELSGLRNDVQRGNRITEENNEMLRRMMQRFHLQGPPYRPQ